MEWRAQMEIPARRYTRISIGMGWEDCNPQTTDFVHPLLCCHGLVSLNDIIILLIRLSIWI
ncbi:hypothetical protein GGE07_005951 [Sinorhizobium terangae]|nr:hypothetical protein [Sinorhizobium terangae]